jgi:hypothetical protein
MLDCLRDARAPATLFSFSSEIHLNRDRENSCSRRATRRLRAFKSLRALAPIRELAVDDAPVSR